MKIKILTDSTGDLPKSIQERMDITITPLTVIKAGQEFKDWVTITPADIFAHVAAGGELCSTSAVSVGEYQDFFSTYSKDYDGIIQVCIGSGFSASYQNACLAAEDFPNVRVIDSMNLTVGQGFLAMKAWEYAKDAASLDELAEKVRAVAAKVETSFIVDKLDYLVKGGRCSAAAALGANLLSLKPCIEVRDNKLVVAKKYRGSLGKCLSAYVRERLEGRTDLDKQTIFVAKSTIPADVYQSVLEGVAAYGGFENTLETDVGCTISCHCGPNTLGIIYLRK